MYSQIRLKVVDIVSEIATHGIFAGYPVTFLKLSGCNLNCKGCKFNSKGNYTNVQNIISSINMLNNKKVVILGGEPLIQGTIYEVVYELVGKGFEITIETNGSKYLEETLYSRAFHYRVNLRTPSTDQQGLNDFNTLENLHYKDEVNFNINNYEDYCFAKDIMKEHKTNAIYVLTPQHPDLQELVESWVLEDKIYNVRIDKEALHV